MPVGAGSLSTQSARAPVESVNCISKAALGMRLRTNASSCTSPKAPVEIGVTTTPEVATNADAVSVASVGMWTSRRLSRMASHAVGIAPALLPTIPGLIEKIGGGDALAALRAAGIADEFSYVSTAGGAFLEWMEGQDLPGVAALIGR